MRCERTRTCDAAFRAWWRERITDARLQLIQILWPVFVTEDPVLDKPEHGEIEDSQVWRARRPSGLAVVGDDLTEQFAQHVLGRSGSVRCCTVLMEDDGGGIKSVLSVSFNCHYDADYLTSLVRCLVSVIASLTYSKYCHLEVLWNFMNLIDEK